MWESPILNDQQEKASLNLPISSDSLQVKRSKRPRPEDTEGPSNLPGYLYGDSDYLNCDKSTSGTKENRTKGNSWTPCDQGLLLSFANLPHPVVGAAWPSVAGASSHSLPRQHGHVSCLTEPNLKRARHAQAIYEHMLTPEAKKLLELGYSPPFKPSLARASSSAINQRIHRRRCKATERSTLHWKYQTGRYQKTKSKLMKNNLQPPQCVANENKRPLVANEDVLTKSITALELAAGMLEMQAEGYLVSD